MKLFFLTAVLLFCISSGASDKITLKTYSPQWGKNYNYFPFKSNHFDFRVKAKYDAHVLFSRDYAYPTSPSYEVIIGSVYNTQIHLRKNGVHVQAYNGATLNENAYVSFSIHLNEVNRRITVTSGTKVLIDYLDYDFKTMNTFAVASYNDLYADWVFDDFVFNCPY